MFLYFILILTSCFYMCLLLHWTELIANKIHLPGWQAQSSTEPIHWWARHRLEWRRDPARGSVHLRRSFALAIGKDHPILVGCPQFILQSQTEWFQGIHIMFIWVAVPPSSVLIGHLLSLVVVAGKVAVMPILSPSKTDRSPLLVQP